MRPFVRLYLLAAVLVAVAICLPAPAEAQAPRPQDAPRLQERDATAAETRRVVSHLTALGYRDISDVDVVGSRFTVDATSPSGQDVDVVLDRRTLAILSVKRD